MIDDLFNIEEVLGKNDTLFIVVKDEVKEYIVFDVMFEYDFGMTVNMFEYDFGLILNASEYEFGIIVSICEIYVFVECDVYI